MSGWAIMIEVMGEIGLHLPGHGQGMGVKWLVNVLALAFRCISYIYFAQSEMDFGGGGVCDLSSTCGLSIINNAHLISMWRLGGGGSDFSKPQLKGNKLLYLRPFDVAAAEGVSSWGGKNLTKEPITGNHV